MNIRTLPDNTGAAPPWAAWSAYDDDTYDGAGSNQLGLGATEAEAVADLMMILEDE